MDAYLQIAEAVLKTERRPLSSKAILASAYRLGIVPIHLHGKTQHKTLGARISEDILERRDRSIFFRTAPGRFFLRQLLTDLSIPEEHRRPIIARRRVRELLYGPALAFDSRDLEEITKNTNVIEPQRITALLNADCYRYDDPKNRNKHSVFLWSFVSVRKSWDVLSYRLGRYREDRDAFLFRRSIGFSTLVHRDERTLFNCDDFGIIESGIRATKIDLDMPETSANEKDSATLASFLLVSQSNEISDLIAVINYECPDWFEPIKRRLALNDLTWLDSRLSLNNVDDFDPWSRALYFNNFFATPRASDLGSISASR